MQDDDSHHRVFLIEELGSYVLELFTKAELGVEFGEALLKTLPIFDRREAEPFAKLSEVLSKARISDAVIERWLEENVVTGIKSYDDFLKTGLPPRFGKIIDRLSRQESKAPLDCDSYAPDEVIFTLPGQVSRSDIKAAIQADYRTFKVPVKCKSAGMDKQGKPIKIDNLSKWLFGVPGRRGELRVTDEDTYTEISLPVNTPVRACAIIAEALKHHKFSVKVDYEEVKRYL